MASERDELLMVLAHSRHENMILKTDLNHTLQQHKREKQELALMKKAKIVELEQMIHNLETKCRSTEESNVQEIKHLQQLNLQLNQKLRLCEDDLNAAITETETAYTSNQNELTQLKLTIKEKTATVQNFKESTDELKEKISCLESELEKERIVRRELDLTLTSERHQLKMIKSLLEDTERQFKSQLGAAKADIEKYKTQNKYLEDNFEKCVEDLKESLELERNRHQEALESVPIVERRAAKQMADLKQSHLAETQKLMCENSEYIAKIQALQHNENGVSAPCETPLLAEVTKEHELKTKELKTSQAENYLLQSKIEECDELKDLLDNERKLAANLRKELAEIVSQLTKCQKENNDFELVTKSLRESLSAKETALKDLMQDTNQERSSHHQKLTEAKMIGKEQLAEAHSRIISLEGQLKKRNENSVKEVKALKSKVKQYGDLIRKLRFRAEKVEIKMKHLEARHEAMQLDYVPSSRYRQLQQHLQLIMNKHSEFRAYIEGLGSNTSNLNQNDCFSVELFSIRDKLRQLIESLSEAHSSIEGL